MVTGEFYRYGRIDSLPGERVGTPEQGETATGIRARRRDRGDFRVTGCFPARKRRSIISLAYLIALANLCEASPRNGGCHTPKRWAVKHGGSFFAKIRMFTEKRSPGTRHRSPFLTFRLQFGPRPATMLGRSLTGIAQPTSPTSLADGRVCGPTDNPPAPPNPGGAADA